jgi:endoglucanase
MDHPGFEIVGSPRNGTARALFLGGVLRELVTTSPVRIFSNPEVRAKVTRVERWDKKQIVQLALSGRVRRGDYGMWDLVSCDIRGDRLTSRGCDDVVGCIALLGALNSLVAGRVATEVWFVFTRAEEVGFHGALALAKSGGLPRSARVVSVETSKEIPPRARMGGGPIVRVGDRAAVFDSELTRFLSVVAVEFAKEEKTFRHQRCLMDGGICEATAFGENGYQAGGLCIALGNYHNIGPRHRIAAEYVSVSDLLNLVHLIVAAATWTPRYAEFTDRLRHRLDDLHDAALRRLSPSFNLLS